MDDEALDMMDDAEDTTLSEAEDVVRDPGSLEEVVGHSDAVEDIEEGVEKAAKVTEAVAKAVETAQKLAKDPDDAVTALKATAASSKALGSLAGLGAKSSEALGVVEHVGRVGSGVFSTAAAAGSIIDAIADAFADHDPEVTAQLLDEEGAEAEDYRVERFEVVEEINALYRCHLRVVSEDLTLDPRELLGKSRGLSLKRGGEPNAFFGIVTSVELRSGEAASVAADLVIEPALAAFRYMRNTRIYQDQSAKEILEELLGPGLDVYGREADIGLEEEYAKREYCVQYEESDLDFILRLCAEEGIGLSFEADLDSGAEKVRLTDHNTQLLPLEGDPIAFENRLDQVPGKAAFRDFHRRRELGYTAVTLGDYDWTRPGLPRPELSAEGDEDGRIREYFDHDTPSLFFDYQDRAYEGSMLGARTDLRTMQRRLRQNVFVGRGNVERLAAGRRFTLEGRGDGFDQEYVVLSVRHRGCRRAEDGESPYENEVVCLPVDRRYLPPAPKQRPRVPGYVTAKVVGPDGEAIHTDVHGRIMVRFHFDRNFTDDAHASCWIRVAQSWSGPGFGAMFIPRVGMEVLIQFEGGNPDRPLCTGCVYNGENAPPLTLPDERTQTVLRTQSTPDSDGYNELRFEDQAGEEEIRIHAQKDMNTTVENDESTTVHGSESLSVDGGRTVTVGGELTRTIKKQATETYENGQDVTVRGAESKLTVDGVSHSVGVTGGETTVSCDQVIRLKSEESQVTINPNVIRAKADSAVSLHCPESHVSLEPSQIWIRNGGSEIKVTDAEILLSNGGSSISIKGDKVQLVSNGTVVKLDGSELDLSTIGTATLSSVGDASVEGAGATVKLTGGQVKLN